MFVPGNAASDLKATINPQVNMIAAVGKRGQLGLDGTMPWQDPDDLAWFKKITMGDVVLFGYNTLRTNPGLLDLEGRTVITDHEDFPPLDFFNEYVPELRDEQVLWIAGGAKTYRRWANTVRHVMVTRIDYDGPADVWMPELWPAPTSGSQLRDII